ncbi:hypothetical protein [Persicobacter sp. CCB-QB2]|uniref:hypothetical protein n=1 Tax=Persicobacter sp. CCB-QB2 TaxID=1561025 RepID=UPI0012FAC11F|nr:hypothetical protein [Persicobacter sp. CCB-QB2]
MFFILLGYQFVAPQVVFLEGYRNFKLFSDLVISEEPPLLANKNVSTDQILQAIEAAASDEEGSSFVKEEEPASGQAPKAPVLASENNPSPSSKDDMQASGEAGLKARQPKRSLPFPKEEFRSKSLNSFYKALDELRKGRKDRVRIAFFGDSMIEGDLIVSTLRSLFQSKFGGQGVGYVPLTSQVAGFRGTIRHQFSDGWKLDNYIFNRHESPFDFGISCDVTYAQAPGKEQWVKYEGVHRKRLDSLQRVRLFYGTPKSESDEYKLTAILDKKDSVNLSLNGNKVVNELQVSSIPVKTLEMKFETDANLPIYGVSVESSKGVFVDDLPLRGSSGTHLRHLNPEVLNSFNDYLEYDLVIMQFGTNVADTSSLNYAWYGANLYKTIRYIQEEMDAPCLVISMADKARKIDGELKTDPAVAGVITAQMGAASRANATFFNLFQAMGGEGSIIDWVESEKPLANKDYTHFNFRGANKVGHLLFDFLIDGWGSHRASNQIAPKQLTQRKSTPVEILKAKKIR